MTRDLGKLANSTFELLVVGGGIYGAVTFWMATVAGLKAALIEQSDFGHATSANSQKIIHGGLRYLQKMDLPRLWQSLRERNRLAWLAPHLVRPLSCTMPLYGHGMKGRESLATATGFYNSVANLFYACSRHRVKMPRAGVIGKSKFLEIFPEFEKHRLTGAAVWSEGICQNTERLVLSFIKSADRLGGVAANYTKAIRYKEFRDGRVLVSTEDRLSHQVVEIVAERVINCTGPWHEDTLTRINGGFLPLGQNFAVGFNLVTKQVLNDKTAIGLSYSDGERSRLFFVVPWRDRSIIGTEWLHVNTKIDRFVLQEAACADFLNKFNRACPTASLTMGDVVQIHWGFVPCRGRRQRSETPSISTKFRIFDVSSRRNGSIVNILGVKYTTAADVAKKALKAAYPGLRSDIFSGLRLVGGEIGDFFEFTALEKAKWRSTMSESLIERLVTNYGTEFEAMLSEGEIRKKSRPNDPGMVVQSDLLKAQTLFAVRQEMAQKISDVVLRRAEQGSAGYPSKETLQLVGQIMDEELCWSNSKLDMEIEEVTQAFPAFIKRERFV